MDCIICNKKIEDAEDYTQHKQFRDKKEIKQYFTHTNCSNLDMTRLKMEAARVKMAADSLDMMKALSSQMGVEIPTTFNVEEK